jgi:hypothetical protein
MMLCALQRRGHCGDTKQRETHFLMLARRPLLVPFIHHLAPPRSSHDNATAIVQGR